MQPPPWQLIPLPAPPLASLLSYLQFQPLNVQQLMSRMPPPPAVGGEALVGGGPPSLAGGGSVNRRDPGRAPAAGT